MVKIIIAILIAVTIVTVVIVGVGINFVISIFKPSKEPYITHERFAAQKAELVLESIKIKDRDTLKEMFCERIQRNPNLDKELDKLFNFMDGDITSYDEPSGKVSSGSTERDGPTEKLLSSEIDNIKTDTGKTYSLGVAWFSINKYQPDRVGMAGLQIFDLEKYDSAKDDDQEGVIWINTEY